MIIRDIYANWPGTGRVIVLTHSKELVEQDAESILWVWPTASLSVYSAGLGEKDITGKVIVAGIQSFANIAHEVTNPSVVLVDECHRIGDSDSSQYLQTLAILREKNPKLVVIGLTATPFRAKGDSLLQMGLFNHIAFDYSSRESFVKFVTEGYLAKLTTKGTRTGFNLDGVGTVGGDYNQKQLGVAVQADGATAACCEETIEKGANRRKWLVFAASIDHAEAIAEYFNERGIRTGVVHSKMGKGNNRDRVINDFKHGKMRCLVNMGVLTTGFDFPGIDLLVLMRPTKSVGLHIQILGRGTRPVFAPGFDLTTREGRLSAIAAGDKADGCLVLDFAENIMRLGPINEPIIKEKKKQKGDAPPMKRCPDCDSQWPARVYICGDCEYEFPPPSLAISDGASEQSAIAGVDDGPQSLDIRDLEVTLVNYSLYSKPGKPPSIRATYHCGLTPYNSWLCFEHKGAAQGLARKWWKDNVNNEDYPQTCEEFLIRKSEVQKPVALRVWFKKPYPEVLKPLYQGEEINLYEPA